MGARRDDMPVEQRMQLALAVLAPHRPQGTIRRLARAHGLSRQTLYTLAASAKQALRSSLAPRPPGPQIASPTIQVDRNRLLRGSLSEREVGLSQRDIASCLAELLDSSVSTGWLHAALARLEQAAAAQNAAWQPSCGESLAGDELFSNGAPNLLVVGNDSLYIYALSRQPSRDGQTWGLVLLDSPECPQFSSDGGSGLAAGVEAADLAVHQADWDHLLRPLWGQAQRLEAQAYAALEAVELRAALFERAHTEGRLERHLRTYEHLQEVALRKVARYDSFHLLAQQIDSWFALIDRESGGLRDAVSGASQLRALGQQIRSLSGGGIYQTLGSLLSHQAEAFFRYQPVLAEALARLEARWGGETIRALARLWQLDADARRHPIPWHQREERERLWLASLDAALDLVGEEQVWTAWEAVCATLGRCWRGSMLAECVNSLQRPILSRRKTTDQGCLELFRFLHNVRPFARGKRAGTSPAQAVGLVLPDDPLTLLGLAPKVSI